MSLLDPPSPINFRVLAGRTYRRGEKPAVPGAGSHFGSFSNLATQTSELASLAYRAGAINRPLDIGHHYYSFTDSAFLTNAKERVDVANRRIPMMSWQLPTLNSIIDGTYDSVITNRAQALAAFAWPVFLRPGWEMNGNWYTWSGPLNNNQPELFVSAWQHIWRLFRQAGATNVAFVWCPNAASSPGGTNTASTNNWRYYYPGDSYVDWVSTDCYNWGDYNTVNYGTWQNLRNVLDPIVTDWKANFGGFGGAAKPFILAEYGCYPTPGNKAHWLTDAFAYIKTSGITAISAFDTNNSVIQGQASIQWIVDSTAQAATAFQEAANDPYFGGYGGGGATYRSRVLLDTPFSYWKLDELTSTYADLGSGGNVGTPTSLVNRGAPALAPGLGAGASFNGSSRVDVGTCGTLGSSLSSGFTIEFLVKVGATSATRNAAAVLGTLNTGTTTGLAVYTDTNRSLVATQGSTTFWYRNEAGTSRACDITTNIYDGLWHHVVWVCDPTAVADTVYVDGAAITLNSSSNAANTGASANFGFPLWIGARNNRAAVDNQLLGAVDELSIYLTKLTSTKVTAHYTALTA